MTSPSLIDLYTDTAQLPAREQIIGYASLMVGTEYEYGSKSAKPVDAIAGRVTTTDCSGFVRAVYHQVFPEKGLDSRDDLNALMFSTTDLFEDVTAPAKGDIICWNGHVGIVYDPDKKEFIGSQTSTGVKVASYGSGYWATTKTVTKFRKWKAL
jgi:cell wall-associated NlpC family hydrolase